VGGRLRTARGGYGRIIGLGAYRPRRVVGNDEVAARIGSTAEWIESRSGIVSRRYAADDETLPVMAAGAAEDALKHAGITSGQLDCVVAASTSNLVQIPPLAVAVGAAIGALNASAFDVSAACAGFCHALAVAGDMVCAGDAEHVLVVGVERMTDITDFDDPNTAFMFGDGAGAVVVGPSTEPGIGPTVRGADIDSLHALRMSSSWAEYAADRTLAPPTIRMDGRRVFRWAVENVVPASQEAMRRAGVTVDELTAFIPHQANRRMLQVLTDRLGLPEGVAVASDITTAGNTSAASIPLGMDQLLRSGAVAGGGPALLVGFGAGLNYAGQVVLLPPAPAAGVEDR
jgi:3-oxoacyl-(acyl-carrier-protein) synthase III